LPVEGLDAQRLVEFMTLCAPVVPRLVITAHRGACAWSRRDDARSLATRRGFRCGHDPRACGRC
jgi:hypothetical protein